MAPAFPPWRRRTPQPKLGLDVETKNIALNPQCTHGPTICFERFFVGGKSRKFYACSACRDQKSCPFFQWADQLQNKASRNSWAKKIKDAKPTRSHQDEYKRLEMMKAVSPDERGYCTVCNMLCLLPTDPHHTPTLECGAGSVINPLYDHQLLRPSRLVPPQQASKSMAQYLFASQSVAALLDMTRCLGATKVLCVGAPTVHEAITYGQEEQQPQHEVQESSNGNISKANVKSNNKVNVKINDKVNVKSDSKVNVKNSRKVVNVKINSKVDVKSNNKDLKSKEKISKNRVNDTNCMASAGASDEEIETDDGVDNDTDEVEINDDNGSDSDSDDEVESDGNDGSDNDRNYSDEEVESNGDDGSDDRNDSDEEVDSDGDNGSDSDRNDSDEEVESNDDNGPDSDRNNSDEEIDSDASGNIDTDDDEGISSDAGIGSDESDDNEKNNSDADNIDGVNTNTTKKTVTKEKVTIKKTTNRENKKNEVNTVSKLKQSSMLLDIDSRYRGFYPPSQFVRFNLFNQHFFEGGKARQRLINFMTGGEKLVVICDPPFGARVELLQETFRFLEELWRQANSAPNNNKKQKNKCDLDESLPVMLVFPYFMEQKVNASLPGYTMLDYQLDYTNHANYTSAGKKAMKHGSAVRVYVNRSAALFALPASQGYRHCSPCQRWVYPANVHCDECKGCMGKDGSGYRHCSDCQRCVKPSWQHCASCDKCQMQDHKCAGSSKLPPEFAEAQKQLLASTCHACGSRDGHRRKDCVKRKREESSRDSPRKKQKGNKRKVPTTLKLEKCQYMDIINNILDK